MAKAIYGAIVERPGQDPILLEMEGDGCDKSSALRRARAFSGTGRYCVVRLEYVTGNRLLMLDMERLAEAAEEDMEIPL